MAEAARLIEEWPADVPREDLPAALATLSAAAASARAVLSVGLGDRGRDPALHVG